LSAGTVRAGLGTSPLGFLRGTASALRSRVFASRPRGAGARVVDPHGLRIRVMKWPRSASTPRS